MFRTFGEKGEGLLGGSSGALLVLRVGIPGLHCVGVQASGWVCEFSSLGLRL